MPINTIFILNEFSFDLKQTTNIKRKRIRNIVFRVFFWLYLPVFAFYDLKVQSSQINSLVSLQLYLTIIFLQLFLFLRRHKIEIFIGQLCASRNRRQQTILIIVSSLLLTKILLFTLYSVFCRRSAQERIARYSFLSQDSPFADIIASLILTFDYLIFDPAWTSMSFPLLVVLLVFFHIRSQIGALIESAGLGDERRVVDVARHIAQTFTSFEDIFSFLPFISLAANFSWAVFSLATFFEMPQDRRLIYLLFSVFHFLLVLSVLLSISLLSENIRKQGSSITTAYEEASSGQRMMSPTLLKVVDEAINCRFTVWKISKRASSVRCLLAGTSRFPHLRSARKG